MKNIEKSKILLELQKFCIKNKINIKACGCCGGYHIECFDDEICSGCNFEKDVKPAIDYYKQNKIYVKINDNKFTNISMIKISSGEIVNLGGKSYPYTKFMKHMKNQDLREFFDYFI